MTAKGEWGKVLDISRKVIGLGSQLYVLFFSGSFIGGSHVCIIAVFLIILALLNFLVLFHKLVQNLLKTLPQMLTRVCRPRVPWVLPFRLAFVLLCFLWYWGLNSGPSP
jgi:H+/Cl- antiporter ClcA